MSSIELYMVHNDQDQVWSGPYTDYEEAKETAIGYWEEYGEPFAVIALEFEYSDSDLAYTTDGSDTWPPGKGPA